MHRRAFLAGALASPLVLGTRVQAQAPVFIGRHAFPFVLRREQVSLAPVAPSLAAGNTTLAAWSLVGDLLWFDVKTYKQKSVPKPGEALGWFQRELGRIKGHIAQQKLKVVRTPADVDLALRGSPTSCWRSRARISSRTTFAASRPRTTWAFAPPAGPLHPQLSR